MKSISLILVALFGVALAQQDVVVTRSEFENLGDSFNWVSELSDGNTHQQSGTLKQIGDAQGISITGSYSYTSPEGEVITVNYVADENGFQPTGDHIPKSGDAGARAAPAAPARRPAAAPARRPAAAPRRH